jgi:hypothetical protein
MTARKRSGQSEVHVHLIPFMYISKFASHSQQAKYLTNQNLGHERARGLQNLALLTS